MQILFVANWKMNMSIGKISAYADIFRKEFSALENGGKDVVFAPPYLYLGVTHDYLGFIDGVALGTQNVHWLDSGAHTGEVSAPMLLEFGVEYAIVGHSERRQFYGENSADVSKRAKACLKHGIKPIVCVGEKEFSESGAGALEVLNQLKISLQGISDQEAKKLIVAYEPIWAIGTGKAATPQIISRLHDSIREELILLFPAYGKTVPILYGGSVSPENISEIMSLENVSGALVGGASLKPDVFSELIKKGRLAKGGARTLVR